jgi:hypothetical protein
MLNAVEDVKKLVFSSADIFSRLRALSVKNRLHKETRKDTDQEENANPRKDYVHR